MCKSWLLIVENAQMKPLGQRNLFKEVNKTKRLKFHPRWCIVGPGGHMQNLKVTKFMDKSEVSKNF